MDWTNAVILAVLVAGHTELIVALINRLHGLPIRCRMLRHWRHLHDVMLPAFPVALFWFVGMRGPKPLWGGSWAELAVGWLIYLGVCAVGVGGLIFSLARHGYRKMLPVHTSNHSHLVDLADRLGRRPIGNGPFQWMTRIPGNEVFHVQVSEKTHPVTRLPQDWNGLSILHLSDFHFIGTVDRPFFEEVCRLGQETDPDLIVFTGDLLDDARLVDWVSTTLCRLSAPLGCYYILGNHDWYVRQGACDVGCAPPTHSSSSAERISDDPLTDVRHRLKSAGWNDVAGSVVTMIHQGHSLAIGGTELPWMGEHPDFTSAPDDAFRLLLSHTPDNLSWAKNQRIDLMLSGHNHGGQVVLPVVGPVYSPSLSGCRYSAGAFLEDPTLLYVTRGISGRHPLRWRCPPELTKLVLTAMEQPVDRQSATVTQATLVSSSTV